MTACLHRWLIHTRNGSRGIGVHGNEKADVMARRGAEQDHPKIPLTLSRASNFLAALIIKFSLKILKDQSLRKKWECLAIKGSIPGCLERAEGVAPIYWPWIPTSPPPSNHTNRERSLSTLPTEKWMETTCWPAQNLPTWHNKPRYSELGVVWLRDQGRAMVESNLLHWILSG